MPAKKPPAQNRSLANGASTANGHRRGRSKGASFKKKASRAGATNGAVRRSTNGHGAPRTALNEHGRVQVPCLSCGICCTYVAVEVEGPTGLKAATEILWYLYHERVSVYRDEDDEWLLQFGTRCQHLLPDNRCRIYEDRPHVCRAFDEGSCEVNAASEGQTFHTPRQYIEYLREHRKAIYRKLEGRFLPPEETWDGSPANRAKLPDFDRRFRKLRVLGAPPA